MRAHLIAAALALAAPAYAQRPAIAPDLSPEAAALAFEDAVINVCLAAVGGGQHLAGLPAAKARLAAPADGETRRRLAAEASESVWDVRGAVGVVAVKESDGRCAVSVYGPHAQPILSAVSAKLVAAGFERLVQPAVGLQQSLTRASGGRRVQATITGSEPGMPGHESRFPVITATLFAMP